MLLEAHQKIDQDRAGSTNQRLSSFGKTSESDVSLPVALNFAAQHGDRAFGQLHPGAPACQDLGSDWRIVRFGVRFRTRRMPNVLLAPERHHVRLASSP